MNRRAIHGADVFDGQCLVCDRVVLLDGDVFQGLVPSDQVPSGYRRLSVDGGTILPGFVDLQVNGGGGVMFNDETSLDGLVAISQAHNSTGTRALLPTLITDTPERTRLAVDAVEAAIAKAVPGIIGIHLEGPHLSVARKGAHDPALIRKMDPEDEQFLLNTVKRLPNVMVTMAPESVGDAQISRLSSAGIIVSLGHTNCTFARARAAFAAGAKCVTHLFNAMSQIANRDPGLVGATLETADVSAGLISDSIHVHPTNMRIALTAKRGKDCVFLVTDAMSTVGSDITEFRLNGRRVLRHDGRLTLEDGTLAGADLDLPTAISVLINDVLVPRDTAYRMATSTPARLLRSSMGYGTLTAGQTWTGIYLDKDNIYHALGDVTEA
ncbi:MAG: N-acetylglucosamine-6-phosphate deacetylase [Pseudomonadota bacterium]